MKTRHNFTKWIDSAKAEKGIEVGCRDGIFSRYLLENSYLKHLFMLDPFCQNKELWWPEDAERHAQEVVGEYKDRAILIKGFSPKAAELFEDESLDFVFIDALHDLDSVRLDLRAWFPKVRSGGLFTGHDYNTKKWPGVVQAVNEFCASRNLQLNITTELDNEQELSWYIYK